MGRWTKIVEKPHKCELPDGAQIRFQGAYVGSQWKCGCGQLWELSMEDMGGLVWFKPGAQDG